MTLRRNTFYCRVVSLLFLIMMVRYHGIYVLLTDPNSGTYTMVVVGLFYLLNIVSMVGMFIPRHWGFVFFYFAVPISTFLFATSYLSFVTDWVSPSVSIYGTPFVNALLLVAVITLQVKRRRLVA